MIPTGRGGNKMPKAWARVEQIADIGLISDLAAHRLPPNSFSSVTNAWFHEGIAKKVLGYVEAYAGGTIAPYKLIAGRDTTGEPWWMVCGLTKVHLFYLGSYSNITRQTASVDVDYTATAENVWTGGVLNSIAILNSGTDAPQFQAAAGGKLANLTNWPANTTAKVVRPYKNFLFALDVTKASTRYPLLVKWSHPADPGSIPSSWDETNDTLDAGEYPLADTPDLLVDCLQLRDYNMIYKEGTTYTVKFVGSPYIFRFEQLSSTSGALSRNCAVTVKDSQVVLSQDDVVLTDGNQLSSIVDKRMRNRIINSISTAYYKRSFVTADTRRNQVMICVPTGNATFPNKAYLWNYQDNTWGERDLPDVSSAAVGGLSESSGTIDGDSGTINSDNTPIDDVTTTGKYLLFSAPGATKLYNMNSGNAANGTTVACELERQDLDFAAADKIKHVSRVRPHLYGAAGVIVNFYIGYKNDLHDAITWGSAVALTIGGDPDICLAVAGRYIGYKLTNTSSDAWGLYDIEFEVSGGGSY